MNRYLKSSGRMPVSAWPRRRVLGVAVLSCLGWLPSAHADCVTTGSSTTCDASSPATWTTTIGAGPSAPSGSHVTVGAGSQVAVGDASAIALSDRSTIVVQTGATVQNQAVKGAGTYKTGANTIDFRNDSTLTVQQGAAVLANGTENNGEAVNPQGTGNLIVNDGTIRSRSAAAIWFQARSGNNTVINNATGVIQAPGNVIGASGNSALDFTNRGQVIGNLVFAGGNDTLRLYGGSTVTGTIDGGGGNNLITLNGNGQATLPVIARFQSIQKLDDGTWTVGRALAAVGATSVDVRQGTLVLTADNSTGASAYKGSMQVQAKGTLQATSLAMPLAVTDEGLVRFAQDADGTYAGAVAGGGAVEKTGAGALKLKAKAHDVPVVIRAASPA